MYIKNIIDVDNFSFIDKIKKIKIEGLGEISKVSFEVQDIQLFILHPRQSLLQ